MKKPQTTETVNIVLEQQIFNYLWQLLVSQLHNKLYAVNRRSRYDKYTDPTHTSVSWLSLSNSRSAYLKIR